MFVLVQSLTFLFLLTHSNAPVISGWLVFTPCQPILLFLLM